MTAWLSPRKTSPRPPPLPRPRADHAGPVRPRWRCPCRLAPPSQEPQGVSRRPPRLEKTAGGRIRGQREFTWAIHAVLLSGLIQVRLRPHGATRRGNAQHIPAAGAGRMPCDMMPCPHFRFGSKNSSRIALTRSAGKRFKNSVTPTRRFESANFSATIWRITPQTRPSSPPKTGCWPAMRT